MTTLTKKQTKVFRADFTVNGLPETLIAKVRFDDECGNGHNTFAVTGELYMTNRVPGEETIEHKPTGRKLYLKSCGCLHDDIAERLPELAPLIKWHLCSTDEPFHYIANTVYHAGDRDHNGLRKGEVRQMRQGKTGLPMWELAGEPGSMDRLVCADECPPPVTLHYQPCNRVGEGKERDLAAARSSAVWPEATDDELMAADLADRLRERHAGLMADFRAAVESLGFTW